MASTYISLPVVTLSQTVNVVVQDLDIRTLNHNQDSIETFQDNHDNLNANANIQINNADASSLNPVPISATSLPLPSGASTEATLIEVRDNLAQIEGYVDNVETLITSTNSKLDTSNTYLSSIDTDVDVALSTRASEATLSTRASEVTLSTRASESTLSTLNTKVNNDYGASSGAVRTASQLGNTTGAANFNAGATGAQTLRTSANITRNGTELSYNLGTSDANTLRASVNIARNGNELSYNSGTSDANTIRTSSNITRNGTELSYNNGASDANTLRTSANVRDGGGTGITSTLNQSTKQSLDVNIANVGQQAMSLSTPVVIASNQSPLTKGLVDLGSLFSISIDLAAATSGVDNPLLLLKNPNGSGKSLYIKLAKAGCTVTNVLSSFKIFVNPTITGNGTTRTPVNTNVGGGANPATVAQLFSLPTISVSGTEISNAVAGQNGNAVTISEDYIIKLNPNNNLLLTSSPSSNNRNMSVTLVWMEV